MTTALLADDEPHLLSYLEQQLAGAWPELHILARAPNGIEALRLIDELAPDVVVLDIQMPGLNGLQLASRLAAGGAANPAPQVVFTTAHEQYALQAFDSEAFDYLLKPIRQERLQRTVARLKEALAASASKSAAASAPALAPAASPDTAARLAAMLRQLGVPVPNAPAAPAQPAPAPPLHWIRAAQGQETRLIAVDEVIYFQSNDKYTSVFTLDAEYLIRTPLRQLREQLDAERFWQIHRGAIVGARHVAGTRTDFRGRLLVKLKGRPEELVVSRSFAELFRQM